MMDVSRRSFLKLGAASAALILTPALPAFSSDYIMRPGEVMKDRIFDEPTTVVATDGCVIRNCIWNQGGRSDAAIRLAGTKNVTIGGNVIKLAKTAIEIT